MNGHTSKLFKNILYDVQTDGAREIITVMLGSQPNHSWQLCFPL